MNVIIRVEAKPLGALVSVIEGSSGLLLYQALAEPGKEFKIEMQGEAATLILPGALYPLRVK